MEPLHTAGAAPRNGLIGATVRNSLSNLAALVWPLVLFFFSAPYILRKLGIDAYGLWLLIYSVVSTMSMFNSGLVDATIKFVSEFLAKENPDQTNRVVGTSVFICMVLGIATVVLAILILPLSASMFRTKVDVSTVRFVFLVCAFGFVCNLFLQNFLSIFKAVQRYDISMRLSVVTETAKIGGILLVLYLGFGLRAVSVAYAGGVGLGVAIAWIAIRRNQPWACLKPIADGATLKILLGFGIYSVVLGASNIGRANLGNILVAGFGSTSEVPYFAIPYLAAAQIMALVSSVTAVFFPLFSSLHASAGESSLERIFVVASKYSTLFGATIGITMFVFSRDLLGIWMGPSFAIRGEHPFRILTLVFTTIITAATSHFYLNGLGQIKRTAMLAIVSLLLIAGLGWVLVPRYGAVGAAYSYAGNLVLLAQIYYVARRIWGKYWVRRSLALFGPIAISGVLVTLGFTRAVQVPLQGWQSIFGHAAVAVLCLLLCTFLLDVRFFLSHADSFFKGSGNVKAN